MKLFALALALFSLNAAAGYDDSWYKLDGFSGEYPNGFAVVDANVTLLGRTEMNTDTPASESCKLPQNAVFHPWNEGRPAEFVTMSKIVTLTVKEDFVFEDGEAKVPLKKGDKIEYLVYGAEGWFLVRINGTEYSAEQSLFEKVEEVDQSLFRQDEWTKIPCEGAKEAWIFLPDLTHTDKDGESHFLAGLDSWFLGFIEYGVVRDLDKKDGK